MKSHLRVHYFQHIAGEGFGSCYSFLKAHKAKITATEFFALPVDLPLELEALPRVDEVDLLMIMGGTMSVNDEANYPWLRLEKRWLRRYLAAGKPAIGLCLGGQLIANALGAAVRQALVAAVAAHAVGVALDGGLALRLPFQELGQLRDAACALGLQLGAAGVEQHVAQRDDDATFGLAGVQRRQNRSRFAEMPTKTALPLP